MPWDSHATTRDLHRNTLQRIAAVCLQFESAWQSGEPLQIVDLVENVEGAERSKLLLQLLAIELHYRAQNGETPSVEDYHTLLPGDIETIQSAFHRLTATPSRSARPSRAETLSASDTSPTVVDPPKIPGYEILDVLGRGGMGVVYLAKQTALNHVVALKTILHAKPGSDEEQRRFLQEADALAQLQHENIVKLHHYGELDGRPFFSMELVRGGSLAGRLQKEKPLPFTEAAQIIETLARAIDAAHQAGIIHRDLKPSNVLIDDPPQRTSVLASRASLSSRLKISDFGLAKKSNDPAQTKTGTVLGTPSYMAPEQADRKFGSISARTDVYGLGAMLYRLITGHVPFKGKTDLDVILKVIGDEDPPPPRQLNRKIPRDLETICLKCLAKNPKHRYESAGEIADRLRLFRAGEPIPDRPASMLYRGWRVVRRNPVRVGLLMLVLLIGAVTLIAQHYLDPNRERLAAKDQLARGKPFVFNGHESLPGPFRQIHGDVAPLRRNNDGASFSFESIDTVLWELADDPQHDHYRIAAEVRHDNALRGGRGGIYFNFVQSATSDGTPTGAIYLAGFSELMNREVSASEVKIRATFWKRDPTRVVHAPCSIGKPYSFQPGRLGQPCDWRKLALEVSPERVRVFWETVPGQPLQLVIDVPKQKLELVMSRLHNYCLRRFGPGFNVPADLVPRRSCGLFVNGGKFSFRNVSIHPLSTD